MKQKKSSWMSALFAYAKNAKGELGLSVVLSVVSILLGLVPFFCMYRVICLFAAGTAAKAAVISWCAWSLAAYAGKVLCFTLSTGISHHAAYNILEGLRLRLVERFLHAPLGEVQKHSIGEIKSILVDKIENIEPPLAHMIPEGAGHIVLPIVSFIALFAIDWRLALAALAVMLSMSMVGSLAKLEVFSENMRQVKATVESLEAFLEMPALPEPAQPAALQGTGVELKNVHFSYSADGPEVLHGIDLALPQGSFTALVGPSGGGKSTVAKLIARFWDVTQGSITIGGVDVRQMPLAQLSGLVSFVTQDNYLFHCSLLENIRLGNPAATDEQVKTAARAAQCEEFIAKLPQGYDTPAGEAGKRLSGGEKQRIAIARMLLKNAPIVILDEATAFTDPENEDKIQQSIAALTRGKTLLVIAHRLSTIKHADNIVVLQNGSILAEGTQAQLLADCPLYRDMWQAYIGAKAWAVSSAGKEE